MTISQTIWLLKGHKICRVFLVWLYIDVSAKVNVLRISDKRSLCVKIAICFIFMSPAIKLAQSPPSVKCLRDYLLDLH